MSNDRPQDVADILEGMDTPSPNEVYEATREYDTNYIAAAAASKAHAGGGGGGSQTVNSAAVTLQPAAIKNLVAVFQTLVAAPGANKMLLPLAVVFSLDFAASAYTDPDAADIQVVWEPGSNTAWDVQTNPFLATQDAVTVMAGNIQGQALATMFNTGIENKALQLANWGGGDLAVGDSPVTITTYYVTVDIA